MPHMFAEAHGRIYCRGHTAAARRACPLFRKHKGDCCFFEASLCRHPKTARPDYAEKGRPA